MPDTNGICTNVNCGHYLCDDCHRFTHEDVEGNDYDESVRSERGYVEIHESRGQETAVSFTILGSMAEQEDWIYLLQLLLVPIMKKSDTPFTQRIYMYVAKLTVCGERQNQVA